MLLGSNTEGTSKQIPYQFKYQHKSVKNVLEVNKENTHVILKQDFNSSSQTQNTMLHHIFFIVYVQSVSRGREAIAAVPALPIFARVCQLSRWLRWRGLWREV